MPKLWYFFDLITFNPRIWGYKKYNKYRSSTKTNTKRNTIFLCVFIGIIFLSLYAMSVQHQRKMNSIERQHRMKYLMEDTMAGEITIQEFKKESRRINNGYYDD